MLVVIAIIHLLPLVGAISKVRVEALYEVELPGKDLQILMQHRAVLFGLLGGFLLFAAFDPIHQPTAFVVTGLSVGSFLLIAYLVGGFNQAIRKVVYADFLALVCLAVAAVAHQV